MADNAIQITEGSGKTVETKTVSSKERQVVILGDPTTAAGVAPVDATDGLTVKINSIASGQAVDIGNIRGGTIAISGLVNVGNFSGGTIGISGNVNIGNITGGTIAISSFPDNEPFNLAQYGGSSTGAGNAIHVQPGTGALFATNIAGGTIAISGVVPVNFSGGTIAIQDGGNSITVDGSVAITNISGGTIAISGNVNIGNIIGGTISVSDVAHDSVDSGNPVKTGGKAYNLDGTVPGTAVVELDRANIITDLYGRQYVETVHPNYWSASENYFTAQGAGNTLVVNPGAGLKLFLTDLVISNGATAGTITLIEGLVDGTTTTKVGPFLLAVNGGAVVNLKTPVVLTANKSLGVVSQTVVDHSVTVSGFTSA